VFYKAAGCRRVRRHVKSDNAVKREKAQAGGVFGHQIIGPRDYFAADGMQQQEIKTAWRNM